MAKQLFYAKSEKGLLTFSNKREVMDWLLENDNKSLLVSIERATGVRSFDQNSALHLWFDQLAEVLNASGFSVQKVLSKKMDMDWTKESVKELLWRSAQIAITQKTSTTELDKVNEIDLIYDHLCRHLGEKFGIETPPFPNDPTKLK